MGVSHICEIIKHLNLRNLKMLEVYLYTLAFGTIIIKSVLELINKINIAEL